MRRRQLRQVTSTLDISAQAVREDRILHKASATGGDIRRLCDLFGLTVGGAERYILWVPKTYATRRYS